MNQRTSICPSVNYLLLFILAIMQSPAMGQSVALTHQNGSAASRTVFIHKDQSIGQYPFTRGDAFRIYVIPDTAHFLNGTYQIDDEGKVFLPMIGRIKVDSMTLVDFNTVVDSIYMPYLRNPNIRIQPLIRVSLLGGFQKPGLYLVTPYASLWDAISLAGGPAREDGLGKIKWVRHGAIVKNNLVADIEKGTSLKNLGFASGDQLCVTRLPKLEKGEAFRTDVLPILSITVSMLTATATVYFAYQAYKGR
jgi:protein involved in polysaccharide export with SLBB domain